VKFFTKINNNLLFKTRKEQDKRRINEQSISHSE